MSNGETVSLCITGEPAEIEESVKQASIIIPLAAPSPIHYLDSTDDRLDLRHGLWLMLHLPYNQK